MTRSSEAEAQDRIKFCSGYRTSCELQIELRGFTRKEAIQISPADSISDPKLLGCCRRCPYCCGCPAAAAAPTAAAAAAVDVAAAPADARLFHVFSAKFVRVFI